MTNKEFHAVISTDPENFGIESKITICRTSTTAVSKIFENSVDILEKIKVKKKIFGKEFYEFLDENEKQYTGRIEKVLVADTPHLQAGEYPYTMDEVMLCFSQHALTTNILNRILIDETRFEKDKQIKNMKDYIKATERSLDYAKTALETLTKANNVIWLSVDETGNEFDLALFYNKDTAISYLSCRFEQALLKFGLRNDERTTTVEKAKYYTEKEKFAKNNKMKYELESKSFKSRGKVICVEII